jgi:hypothetical protein
MSVIDYEDLQLLSGYKQVGKVVAFLRDNKIRFVVGGDGKPRTTNDMLQEDLRDEKSDTVTEVRFS